MRRCRISNSTFGVVNKSDVASSFPIWILQVICFLVLVCLSNFWVTCSSFWSDCLPKRLVVITMPKQTWICRSLLLKASLGIVYWWKFLIGTLRDWYSSNQRFFALWIGLTLYFPWRLRIGWWGRLLKLVVHKLRWFNPHTCIVVVLFLCCLRLKLQRLAHASTKANLFHSIVFFLDVSYLAKRNFHTSLVETCEKHFAVMALRGYVWAPLLGLTKPLLLPVC